jgi:glutamate-ammonia-ligase adenylyltransferase
VRAALTIVEKEITRRFTQLAQEPVMPVLALGRMGGRGMDYGSDLDLVLVYDDETVSPVTGKTHKEFYQVAAEIFVTVLSSFTRHGNLYRVDLRLRPDGMNGPLCCGKTFFLDYLESRAAIWEWLAYVKLRAVAGPVEFSGTLEQQAKAIIHTKAKQVDDADLKAETLRVRQRLEEQKSKNIRNSEIDLKYSAGGLLDIYFLIRYLQLKNDIPDEDGKRSTLPVLESLHAQNIIDDECFSALSEGYSFLRKLDHSTRLIVGKTSRLPGSGHPLLDRVAKRAEIDSAEEMLQTLTTHRIEIRRWFEKFLAS